MRQGPYATIHLVNGLPVGHWGATVRFRLHCSTTLPASILAILFGGLCSFGGPFSRPVATVSPPRLRVVYSPGSLPAPLNLRVVVKGTRSLSWSASCDKPWLFVSP